MIRGYWCIIINYINFHSIKPLNLNQFFASFDTNNILNSFGTNIKYGSVFMATLYCDLKLLYEVTIIFFIVKIWHYTPTIIHGFVIIGKPFSYTAKMRYIAFEVIRNCCMINCAFIGHRQ